MTKSALFPDDDSGGGVAEEEAGEGGGRGSSAEMTARISRVLPGASAPAMRGISAALIPGFWPRSAAIPHVP
jgi:hypothetical protein